MKKRSLIIFCFLLLLGCSLNRKDIYYKQVYQSLIEIIDNKSIEIVEKKKIKYKKENFYNLFVKLSKFDKFKVNIKILYVFYEDINNLRVLE